MPHGQVHSSTQSLSCEVGQHYRICPKSLHHNERLVLRNHCEQLEIDARKPQRHSA